MDPVLLSRIQFALTIGFHFIFTPLTIGLAWFILWMLSRHLLTGDQLYRTMARFWIRIFALGFVMGVASGITMEFQFGTNWAEYSRFVGDIFGAPLAAEGIFAFFLESTFLAVLLFGSRRVSARIYWFSALMVALGSTLSGFWIIAANSWQQTPAGFIMVEGKPRLADFWQAVFNPSTMPRFLHTIDGALITASFFLLGLGAWFILKGRQIEFARRTMGMALVGALVSSLLQLGFGHYHTVQVAHTQPEKLAAVEGLFETQSRAPLLLFGIPDAAAGQVRAQIALPSMLSILAYGRPDAEVPGLADFPRNQWPPMAFTFYPFHLMFGLGLFFIAISFLGVWLYFNGRLFDNRAYLTALLWSIPLPFVANELGWITAEVGRQPWVVYHLLRTRDAVSIIVPGGQILFSLIIFCLIYALLFAIWIFLLRRELEHGPESHPAESGGEVNAWPLCR